MCPIGNSGYTHVVEVDFSSNKAQIYGLPGGHPGPWANAVIDERYVRFATESPKPIGSRTARRVGSPSTRILEEEIFVAFRERSSNAELLVYTTLGGCRTSPPRVRGPSTGRKRVALLRSDQWARGRSCAYC